jgi:uncharacterized protein (DUF1778 family)
MPTAPKKEKRLHLRATVQEVRKIERAAASTGVSLSEFILVSAEEKAEQTLADQREFSLSAAKWNSFLAALDQPPKKYARLARLLKEPSVLERT